MAACYNDSLESPNSFESFKAETESNDDSKTKTEMQKVREILSGRKMKIQTALVETLLKWKKKVKDKFPTERFVKPNDPSSRVFVTRSSKDFFQYQIEDPYTSTQPTYIYPILTASVVCFPYAIKHSGIVLGALLILTLVMMLDYSEYLLIQCSLITEERNVPVIARNLFGKIGYCSYFGVPYFLQFCVLLSYFVILGDTSTKCINFLFQLTGSFQLNRDVVLLLLFFIVVPLSMTRNIKRIFKWSLLSLTAVSLLAVLIIVRLFMIGDQVPKISQVYRPSNVFGHNILQSVAMVTFTLSCQHAHRLCYMNVNINKDFDASKPANIVAAYSILCTVAVAVCGYATFNMFTQANVLENYCEEDILASITRLVMTLFTLCLFPLECQNIRFMTEELVIVHQKFKPAFYMGVTVLILVPTFVASLFIQCLPLLLELSGLFFAIPMVFILPQLLFLKLFPGNFYHKEKIPCFVSIILGIVFAIGGLGATLFTGHNCIHSTALLPYCNGSSELIGPLITLMSLNGTTSLDENVPFNMSSLEKYGFENLTDIVNAYLS